MARGGPWHPLIDNSQESPEQGAQSTEEQLYTPARRSAVADISIYIYILEKEIERELIIVFSLNS